VRVVMPGGVLKFVAGLAAGILVGVGVHVFMSGSPAGSAPPAQAYAANTQPRQVTRYVTDLPPAQPERSGGGTRNMDLFSFTDDSGTEYLIEGYRENVVKPALRGGI